MEETFRLDLNQSWEAIDIKTGHAVLIPKGSHQAIRMLLKSPPDQTEENYSVVAVQDEVGKCWQACAKPIGASGKATIFQNFA